MSSETHTCESDPSNVLTLNYGVHTTLYAYNCEGPYSVDGCRVEVEFSENMYLSIELVTELNYVYF